MSGRIRATIAEMIASVTPQMSRYYLRRLIGSIGDRLSSQTLQSGALTMHATNEQNVETTAVYYGIADGKLVTIAADVTLADLSGTVTQAKFNVFVFYVDSAGAFTSAMGFEGTTLADVIFPVPPLKKAIIGFVIVQPTVGSFIGDTTDLDDGTVIPRAVIIDWVGAGDATVLVGRE